MRILVREIQLLLSYDDNNNHSLVIAQLIVQVIVVVACKMFSCNNGQNIPIQLKGNPIYTQQNDTYYNVDENGTQHPPPQIWLCRDTYFIASTDGLQYVGNGSPEGSQA